MDFNDSYLLYASLLWGSVGVGYWVYGKKQRSIVPMLGGASMIGVSYIAPTAELMSMGSIALIVAIHLIGRRFD
ncbi:MAG TPA: hypothetical protein VK968_17300 [Roseimicrobium sp.]|nr:hypothetical protein [Roseimicrobium sp.]